ncbi:T9SS type A sorting domain-containing protein [Brumimicrobium aurantiacum]|uniref:T9SS C-terminal target domain-containing protein n=1 Tax=Brumimicrobium aurantiacum TaxID=1737063 RepID=A0A3E1EUB2_9FLAO|nr:T9SS type A sorting domain-containing protein [Brumimicrobium aurantiacum]RFC53144.1 T9SS C-terminal target domain-containing protein [Brumimicrobium aurantiacum]
MKKIYFSALALIATASINAQVLNPGFESWTNDEPDDWNTLNILTTLGDVTDGTNPLTPATEVTTGATEGSSYIELTTFNLANSTDPTNAPDGDYGGIATQDIITSTKYESFSMDVKYDVAANDTAIVFINAYNAGGTAIGQGFATFAGTEATFQNVTVDMQYIGSVSEYTIFIASSESQILQGAASTLTLGSTISVDNITVGPAIPDAPNATNIVASDVSDNEDGSDLTVSFDTPDETNVSSYYVLAMTSAVTPSQLNDDIGFIKANGIQITPNGSNQTYNFTATGEYWKINAAGNAVEAAAIVPNEEMVVYVLVEGANGYNDVYDASNAITLDGGLSVEKEIKEINVYPNPASNFVNIKVDGLVNGTVTINSVTGQEVVNSSIVNGTKKVNVSDLNNGVYIYTVRDQNGEVIKTNKLVVRK